MQDGKNKTFPPSPLLLVFVAVDPSLSPMATVNEIANEKGSIRSDSHGHDICDEPHHGSGAKGVSSLSAHTYVHNTTPQLRAIANPGPL